MYIILYINTIYFAKKFVEILFSPCKQLITMFFGANDLCSGQCYDKDGTTPLQHSKKLQKALDYLQANLPRTFINLVPVLGEYEISKYYRHIRVRLCYDRLYFVVCTHIICNMYLLCIVTIL